MRCALLALLMSFTIAAPTAAEIRALVIGIDEYDNIPSLDGAVNDARDIAAALEERGAEVTLLLNRDANRDRIISEWRRVAGEIGPGDLFVVSYAGHGSNEPEFWSGNEFDGRDETLLLSGFSPSGDAAGERIRDDEIADLLRLAPARQTVFVADACHAGTLSRSVNPVLGYRYYAAGELVDDPLPPPPPNTARDEGRGELGLFLAAVDENTKVPEFLIDGQARGALSYAFAEALRGQADKNADDNLTLGEIETYVRRTIRGISRGLQRPQIARIGSSKDVLLSLTSPETSTPARSQSSEVTSPWSVAFDDLPRPGLHSNINATNVDGVRLTAPSKADLTFSGTELRSSIGDLIAKVSNDALLQKAIDKSRLTDFLMNTDRHDLLDVYFANGDSTYFENDILEIRVSGRKGEHLTLFNIASDGQIAFLYPLNEPALGIVDPKTFPPGKPFTLELEVTPPFGADHVFAVETDAPAPWLREAIRDFNGSNDIRGFWNALRMSASEQTGDVRLVAFPFFTAAR